MVNMRDSDPGLRRAASPAGPAPYGIDQSTWEEVRNLVADVIDPDTVRGIIDDVVDPDAYSINVEREAELLMRKILHTFAVAVADHIREQHRTFLARAVSDGVEQLKHSLNRIARQIIDANPRPRPMKNHGFIATNAPQPRQTPEGEPRG